MGGLETVGAVAARVEGLIDVGRFGVAEAVAIEGLTRWPGHHLLLGGLIRARLAINDGLGAIETAESLVELHPGHWASHLWYSRAVRLAQPFPMVIEDTALPAARRAVELAPAQAMAHHELGQALLGAVGPKGMFRAADDRLTAAAESAARAIELAPNWAAAHVLAAATASRLGDRRGAAEHAGRALELSPSSEFVLRAAHRHELRPDVKRSLAARLAVTVPSDDATQMALAAHRPSPRFWVGWVLCGLISLLVADFAKHGDLPFGGPVVSATGTAVAVFAVVIPLGLRRRRLLAWDEVIRSVVLEDEHDGRWHRRTAVTVVMILPLLWIPAAIKSGHHVAFAFSIGLVGIVAGLGYRPRFSHESRV